MPAPGETLILRAGAHTLELRDGAPVLMGILNASPDSFSSAPDEPTAAAALVERGLQMRAQGALILDVGGESARGDRPAVAEGEEIARVVPVVAGLAAAGAVVSVDTYKPEVARAAVAAGAAIVNDVSGGRDPGLFDVCAQTGAGLVVMHTAVRPKGTLLHPGTYTDVAADVLAFLTERMAAARAAGVATEQLLLDPGPDFAKTPAQTVAALRALPAIRALGRPVLLAASRKDFVGAVTGRLPRERGAGTLAALAYGADHGAHVLRVHDVEAATDFLAVRAVLNGDRELAPLHGLTPERYPDGPPSDLQLG